MRELALVALVALAATAVLVGCGAMDDPERGTEHRRTSLGAHLAAGSSAADLLPGVEGLTPLHVAARLGDLDAIRTLASEGADLEGLDGRRTGWTPLLHAVHKNQVPVVITLLALGADPNRTGAHGPSPLLMAAGYGNTEMVRALLDGGADPYLGPKRGGTALLAAVIGSPDIDRFTLGSCQAETVRLLLERAPDLRLPDSPVVRLTLLNHRLRGCSEMRELLRRR